MDRQAIRDMTAILKNAGVNLCLLDSTTEELIDVFINYRRRIRLKTKERRKIEAELRNPKTEAIL